MQQGNARAAPLKAEAMHAMEVEPHLVEGRAMSCLNQIDSAACQTNVLLLLP